MNTCIDEASHHSKTVVVSLIGLLELTYKESFGTFVTYKESFGTFCFCRVSGFGYFQLIFAMLACIPYDH